MSRTNKWFESTLERRVRIMADKYDVRIVIRGSSAYTDGKTIYLPMLEDIPEEVMADLDAFADHELAHCKYSDFGAMKTIRSRFHKELFNAVEDSRIEILLPMKFPGTKLSLDRLNRKWGTKVDAIRFDKNPITGKYLMPWPIRLIICIREIYDGKVAKTDEIVEPILAKIIPDIHDLHNCKTSRELLEACEALRHKINKIREDMFDGSLNIEMDDVENMQRCTETAVELDPDRHEKESKEAEGAETYDPACEFAESDKGEKLEDDDAEKTDSESDEAENGEGTDSESGEAGEGDSTESDEDSAGDADFDGESEGKAGDVDEDMDSDSEGAGDSATDHEQTSTSDSGSDTDENTDEDAETSRSKSDPNSESVKHEAEEVTDGQLAARDETGKTLERQKTTDNKAKKLSELQAEADNWEETEVEKEMLTDSATDKDSEFDKHVYSSESFIGETLEKVMDETSEDYKGMYDDYEELIDGHMVSLPFSREFDKVIDYTGQGDTEKYAAECRAILPLVGGIKQHLERSLKVKENARMRFDRERGAIDTRVLAKLTVDPNFRTPFRDFTKTETKNVAVQLFIDCSGSMAGSKIKLARETAIALGESLKAINIPFEVCGFTTVGSPEMREASKNLTADDRKRFNRFGTALKLMVFKDFNSQDLRGITYATSGDSNADGESIVWAAKRLALRKEPRKILIVLSDGQPAAEGSGMVLAGDLKRVVSLLPKAGIEPIGIGVLCDSPKLFYPKWVKVSKLEELPTTVMGELSRMLIDGIKGT